MSDNSVTKQSDKPDVPIETLLRSIGFFNVFQENELKTLAAVLKPRQFLPQQIVFRERDKGDSCFFVAGGEVISCKAIMGSKKKEIISTYGVGAVFGFVSLIDLKPRFSTCFAHTHSILLQLCHQDFDALFKAKSPFAFKFQEIACKILVNQLKLANNNLAYFTEKPKQKRKVEDAFEAIIGTSKLVEDLGFNLDEIEVLIPDGQRYRSNRDDR